MLLLSLLLLGLLITQLDAQGRGEDDLTEAITTLSEELNDLRLILSDQLQSQKDLKVAKGGRDGPLAQIENLAAMADASLMKQRVEESDRL